ncbi:MAG: GTPase [Candidatus Heimdallarchaeota archaeon]|nr:GTPase [Candidatus Heimdallarchaeota archaeon]MCK5048035.1 GTPase [Candidatus Heimdallarchaeota archaeon]
MSSQKKRVLILGAAGKDFHIFNMIYRTNEEFEIVGFTATQIPDIVDRKYPAELSGNLYPEGIKIYDEADLASLITELKVEEAVFAYSDVKHEHVMQIASIVNANGAIFKLHAAQETMLETEKPVVAVCAVRTGCGKSQTSRYLANQFRDMGLKAVAIRHPMPYGDLVKQKSQRFATYEDLDLHECTIEEREEYEPYIDRGLIVYSGVDYEAILREAEKEADVIIWDGGNNDTPFIKPSLHLVVADPHRTGHELIYHPGNTNFLMADVIIINKCDSAEEVNIEKIASHANKLNPSAVIIKANSPLTLDEDVDLNGKKVLVIEDGPTITHGDMPFGAGTLIAKANGATIVDPRSKAKGSIKEAYEKYTHLEAVLPALGYYEDQLKDLEDVIDDVDCDIVVSGTPIDLKRIINVKKPMVHVTYELAERDGEPLLSDLVKKAIE